MVDAPIPLSRTDGSVARNRATSTAKEVIKTKLMNKDYDKGFSAERTNDAGSSQKLLNISNDTSIRKIDRPNMDKKQSIEDIINSTPRDPSTYPLTVPVNPGTKLPIGTTITEKKYTNSLAIVSSDHEVEDSPNAGHVNEALGKSTAMMAVKTLAKRKSITDGNSKPLSRKMKSRYVYEEESALKKGLKKLAALRENEDEEVTNNSDKSSPNDKNKKPEKRGDLVTINPKLNDSQ